MAFSITLRSKVVHKMKFVVVVLSLVGICNAFTAFTDDDREKARIFVQDCAAELEVMPEELHEYMSHTKNFVDEPKAQNLIECFFQKFGFIDEKGNFQERVVIEKLAKGDNRLITKANVKQCTTMAGDSKANAFAIKLYACYQEVANKVALDRLAELTQKLKNHSLIKTKLSR